MTINTTITSFYDYVAHLLYLRRLRVDYFSIFLTVRPLIIFVKSVLLMFFKIPLLAAIVALLNYCQKEIKQIWPFKQVLRIVFYILLYALTYTGSLKSTKY